MPKRKLDHAENIDVKTEREKLFKSDITVSQDIVEIYKDTDVNGILGYSCPFCNFEPTTSDIRFRKHLKQNHPKQKILLKDKESRKNPNIPFELDSSKSVFSLLNNKENQLLGISLQSAKDADGSPMIIISENPLVTSPEKTSSPSKPKSRGRPLSAKGAAIQELVRNCFLEDVEEKEEDLRCEICLDLIEEDGDTTNFSRLFDGNNVPSLLTSLGSIVEGFNSKSLVCQNCEDVAREIIETKEEIKRLETALSQTVSKLLDLAFRGQALLSRDLETEDVLEGLGLGPEADQQLVVKVLEESRLDRLNITNNVSALSQHYGKLRLANEAVKDDGSSPQSADVDSNFSLFLTQHEWASGGLSVNNEIVYVPCDLVGGLAMSNCGIRNVISKELCQDLLFKYNCLDCGKGFEKLAMLVDHSEKHCSSATNVSESLDFSKGSLLESSFINNIDNEEQDFDENDNQEPDDPKADDLKMKDMTQSDQYKIQLRSYMHKEQFKDCLDEVPTLDKPFQCKECNKTFERAHDLWGHHASFRGPAFKCNFKNCEEVFLRLPDFAVHYSAHAGVNLVIPESSQGKKTLCITCPVCSTVVPGLYKLQRHKMKHDPELKYKCPVCPKQFVKANTLRMHISNVHKGSKNQRNCNICNAVVSSEVALQEHIQSVHSTIETKNACNLCGELFNNEQEVLKHKNTNHTGWNNITPKTTVQLPKKSTLVEQLQTPTTNRVFDGAKVPIKLDIVSNLCPECDQELGPGTTLSQHFIGHHPGMEQRFQCSECDPSLPTNVKFLTLAGARKHYHMCHRNRSLICWICKDSHSSEDELHTHLTKRHADLVGVQDDEVHGIVSCHHCSTVFGSHAERVRHTRFTHLVESIDITTTDLEEVTMVGGHVIEYGLGSERIVALHTIP